MIVIVTEPGYHQKRYHFPPGRAISIGRSRSNDIMVHQPTVSSGRHARVEEQDGKVSFLDLNAANPARLNELEVGASVDLSRHDFIELPGGVELKVLPEWEVGAVAPCVEILNVGARGHGKTILFEALQAHVKMQSLIKREPLKNRKHTNIDFYFSEASYQTELRRYAHFDFPATHLRKGILSGATRPDTALLVIGTHESLKEETKEQLRLLYRIGVRSLVVFLNYSQSASGAELLDQREREVRGFLNRSGFLGDETPVIRGNALALFEKQSTEGLAPLLEALDAITPPVPKERDGSFLLEAAQESLLPNEVVGRVQRGTLSPGDSVQIVSQKHRQETRIKSIQTLLPPKSPGQKLSTLPREMTEVAEAGQLVLCQLTEDIYQPASSFVLASPDTVRLYSYVFTETYALRPDSKSPLHWWSGGPYPSALRVPRLTTQREQMPSFFEEPSVKVMPEGDYTTKERAGQRLLYDLPAYFSLVFQEEVVGFGVITSVQ